MFDICIAYFPAILKQAQESAIIVSLRSTFTRHSYTYLRLLVGIAGLMSLPDLSF